MSEPIVLSQEEKARDLSADLAVCDAATPGPWDSLAETQRPEAGAILIHVTRPTGGGSSLLYIANTTRKVDDGREYERHHAYFRRREDSAFCAIARTALPVAIRRALAAEAALKLCRAALVAAHERVRDEEG